MLRSAAQRIALAYALAFAIATVLLGGALYYVAHRSLARQFDERIAAEMSSLRNEYGEGEPALRAVIAEREHARATNDMIYGLFDTAGHRLAGSLPTVRPAVPGWQTMTFVDPAEGPDSARAYAVDIAPQRRLVVAADWDTLADLDRLVLSLLGAALIAMAALGTLGAVLLSIYLRSRLAVITGGAEQIIAGNLAQRIPIGPRDDEFDRVAVSLNAMLDRIAALLDNLRQVSADIAHDLRMPLTRLRNQLERGSEGGDAKGAIDKAIDQTDQLLALFGAILRLSEIEAGQLWEQFAPVDLGALATELSDSYAPAVEDGGRLFSARIAPTPSIHGDRELLAQAIVNLLDNALIHTPPGTRIQLAVSVTPDRICVSVADDGPGVALEHHAAIVRRFVRLEASRSRPGNGLGLSMVAAIAHIHGATLRFDDNAPGLVAMIAFPR